MRNRSFNKIIVPTNESAANIIPNDEHFEAFPLKLDFNNTDL